MTIKVEKGVRFHSGGGSTVLLSQDMISQARRLPPAVLCRPLMHSRLLVYPCLQHL
jgi:hypothetical protein